MISLMKTESRQAPLFPGRQRTKKEGVSDDCFILSMSSTMEFSETPSFLFSGYRKSSTLAGAASEKGFGRDYLA